MILPKQRLAIDACRRRLGWTAERLDQFLVRTLHAPLARLARRRDASRAIAVLVKIIKHYEGKQRAEANAAKSPERMQR